MSELHTLETVANDEHVENADGINGDDADHHGVADCAQTAVLKEAAPVAVAVVTGIDREQKTETETLSATAVLGPSRVNAGPDADADADVDAEAEAEAETDFNADDEEDLEDGEIDDDDDDDNDKSANVASAIASNTATHSNSAASHNALHDDKVQPLQHGEQTPKMPVIDLSHEHTPSPIIATPTNAAASTTAKSKRGQPLEDDHALNVENAILNVLKKKGIEPQMPKLLESRNGPQDAKDNEIQPGQGQSRSSKRRKRKKQRDEKEKERKEKKRRRYGSPNPSGPPPLEDEDDMDDFEMLNVRGGSPPMGSHQLPPVAPSHYKDQYDSAEDSCSTEDSFESAGEGGGGMGGGGGVGASGEGVRRRRRGKKERKRRERRGRSREDERYTGRPEKRSRRDSADDKHRQEPRKLELCKFYLMECCAKKEKCSYMHADFPCKYYYLGMDCVYKEECKFSHGKPLTEQLRNILLKHLETAPKEILGNFKRISRESAIAQMTKRNEELCKEFGVDNTWSTIMNVPMSSNRRGGGGGGGGSDQMNFQMQQQQQQQQRLQMQQQQQQQSQLHSNIPSLLDIVIKPPTGSIDGPALLSIGGAGINAAALKGDKHRKSRWADSDGIGGAPSDLPSYLNLKNLTGVLSAEHIEKLSQLGIANLEQMKLLTVGQLNQIGLTIAEISEISEIQKNAVNMAKLGVTATGGGRSGSSEAVGSVAAVETRSNADAKPPNRDVDMRSVPSATTTSVSGKDAKDGPTDGKHAEAGADPEQAIIMSSSSNSNSSSGVLMVNYSQYLKDSNLAFDRSDGFDDERDEELLVIDDGNMETEENATAPVGNAEGGTKSDEHKLDSYRCDLPPRIPASDFSAESLVNPFSRIQNPLFGSRETKAKDQSGQQNRNRNPFKTYHNDFANDEANDDYGRSRMRSRSHSRSRSRSRSRTPTRSQSSTPEASQSPDPEEGTPQPVYERSTMYDLNARQAEEDEKERIAKGMKADKDMRFLQSSSGSGGSGSGAGGLSDIDLCLPFQPVPNYMPATEIDASITSHLPMTYKVYEMELPTSNYAELRKTFKSAQTDDPRLRRILGLPELLPTRNLTAFTRPARKLSNNLASPDSEDSPKYYTPPSSNNSQSTATMTGPVEERKQSKASSVTATAAGLISQPRFDPRRAAAQAAGSVARSVPTSSITSSTSATDSATQQKNEIRRLLQNSDWYKNLNSKAKIMVNQQVELLSTELRKFHQDTTPNKNFDLGNVMNSTLTEILTQLGVFINDSGELEHVEKDERIPMPNLSQPPPHFEFLRHPPPISVMSIDTQPSLLRMPSQFAYRVPQAVMSVGNFGGGPMGGAGVRPGLMGPGPPMNFGNFSAGIPQFMPPRGYPLPGGLGGLGGIGQRNQRNQQNRRNNFGGGNNIL